MNTVDFRDVLDEIFGGDRDFQRRNLANILFIQRWLGIGGPPCFKVQNLARTACSLTSRAEAELFGVSYPRFCVRLYADNTGRSFFNLRRSALLIKSISANGGWSDRRADPTRRIAGVAEYTIASCPVTDKPPVIGDSVLAIPERFASDYHVISVPLHSSYGENSKSGDDGPLPTTPFIGHHWATGLCAHGAIFIAATLLRKHVVAVHALAEIAAVLRSHATDEILITGLSPRHIARYCAREEVGLRAYYQISPSPLFFEDLLGVRTDREECFANALRSYVLSGMPVIKHVDKARMFACGGGFDGVNAIYDRNDTGTSLPHCPGKTEEHCVVVLGCATDRPRSGQADFLLHDPGAFPYLEASASELMSASTYRSGCNCHSPSPELTRINLQPVTPGAVRMPLHRQEVTHDGKTQRTPGLYQITIQVHQWLALYSGIIANPPQEEYLRGEFRLVQAFDILRALNDLSWLCADAADLPTELAGKVLQIQEELVDFDREHWFWVQRFHQSCWVWDAQKDPPPNDDYEKGALGTYLVAIAAGGPQGPALFKFVLEEHPVADQLGAPPDDPPFTFDAIGLSLITSFNSRGWSDALLTWPASVSSAELYMAMQSDVLRCISPGRPDLSAEQAMSSLRDNAVEIDRIAEAVGSAFHSRGVDIRALATFLPELLHFKSERQRIARDALVFLCQLTTELRKPKNGGHSVDVIEIVGGSIISGVLPVKHRGKTCILGNRRPPTEPASHFMTALASMYTHLEENDIKLAIEAEPGPLFAFGSEPEIDALVSQIISLEASGDLPPGRIGLNVDIGHWILMNIPPSKLRDPRIAPKVFSGHISDHAKAHAGDSIIGTANDIALFEEWIRELRRLPRETFGGKLSLEFECATDAATLQVALNEASAIL